MFGFDSAGVLVALVSMGALAIFVRRHLRSRSVSLTRIAAQRALLDNALRSIDDAVFITDSTGRISGLNPAAERMTGWSEAAASGVELNRVLITRRADSNEPEVLESPKPPRLLAVASREGVERMLEITDREGAEADVARLDSLLHAINEATPDHVFTKDREGRLTYANEATCRGLGRPLSELLGKTDEEFQPNAELAREIMATDQRIMRTGVAEMIDELVDLSEGARWFHSAKSPQRNSAGAIVGLTGVSRDITARKAAEAALVESEARFRTMADNAPVMIWVTNAVGECTYTNAQWAAFIGGTLGTDVPLATTVHPEDVERFRGLIEQLPRQCAARSQEFRVRRSDGRFRWMLCTATPRYDDLGAYVGAIGSMLDVEDRRVLEDDLRGLAADLSEADHRKDEFLATLAHELRNPLAPIRNGLEILRLSLPPNDTTERTRGMMERQLTQIVRLVDDLLDVSRISSGKLSLQRARFDLRGAITLAVESTSAAFAARAQPLVYAAAVEPIWVDGDRARLAQVVINLLDNASKYSPAHTMIWLSADLEGTSAVIRVRDRGHGIPTSMLTKIFDLFIQVDRSLERSQSGLGIGLTLVKRLVEMHGGTVGVDSDGAEQGSTFVVRLPVDASDHDELTDEAHGEGSPDTCRTILVADDNIDGAATLAAMLAAQGHRVEIAHDGLEAVALAQSLKPTVIVLDIGMPGLNGYEVCQRLRAMPWAEHATIVALSGWGQEDDRRRSREAGFDDHIVKPVDPSALSRLVRRVRSGPEPTP